MDYWVTSTRQRIETVPHLGMSLLVENVRMGRERVRCDGWSKEDALPLSERQPCRSTLRPNKHLVAVAPQSRHESRHPIEKPERYGQRR